MELNPNLGGLDEAAARLAELEASDSGDAGAIPGQTVQREDGSLERAGAGSGGTAQAGQESDTRAAAGKAADDGKGGKAAGDGAPPGDKDQAGAKAGDKGAGKAGDKAAEDGEAGSKTGESRYQKGRERLERTWDAVNKRKAELETREQQLTAREQAIQQRQADLERQASQGQYTPEQYEQAAGAKAARAKALHDQADGIEAKAQSLEDAGKYGEAATAKAEAKAVRKRANQEEGNAEDLKAHAAEVRKNPPPNAAQQAAQVEQQRKAWTGKAATDFPDLAKAGSELQKGVVEALNDLWKNDRALASHPGIIYHATRLVAAEQAAARVSGMAKELTALRARVKELEELTTPGGEDNPRPGGAGNAPKTDEEERAELGELAQGLGSLR